MHGNGETPDLSTWSDSVWENTCCETHEVLLLRTGEDKRFYVKWY